MYSRAHLLIELEQEKFLADPPWGIEAWPIYDDTIFEWMAKIKGLKNTPWEDGIFKVYIRFDEHYNVRPPRIVFHTIPFHPNVDVSTGRPCVDFLDDYQLWNEEYSLSTMLVSIQTLLSNPVCENAVNADAAQMLMLSPEHYHQMIRECVATSQLIEAGASVEIMSAEPKIKFNNATIANQPLTAPSRTQSVQVKKLSFEEYHKTWLSIATSKAAPNGINPLTESVREEYSLQNIHQCLSREEIEEIRRKQLEVHRKLVFGHFANKQLPETDKDRKLARLDKMRQLYLPPRQSPVSSRHDQILQSPPSKFNVKDKQDAWEEEVDDLVKWSCNLSSKVFDSN